MNDPISEALKDIRKLLDIADLSLGLTGLRANADKHGVELTDEESADEYKVSSRLSDYKDSRIDTIIDNLARGMKEDFETVAAMIRSKL